MEIISIVAGIPGQRSVSSSLEALLHRTTFM